MSDRPTVIFSHGQESGPWGSKIRAMADVVKGLGCETDSIDYQGMADASERASKLVESCRSIARPIILVGSSMGGQVAAAAAVEVSAAGLFVLAPAFFMPGFEDLTPPPSSMPIEIVHGWRDDIVPHENSVRFASACHATLHLVDGDHRLTENINEINYYLARFVTEVAA